MNNSHNALHSFFNVILIVIIFMSNPLSLSAQDESSSFLITGVLLHTAAGAPIENGAVGVRDGLITFAGKATNASRADYSEVIDRTGMHLYPGLIATNTTLGLTEIFAVRATDDYREAGKMNPNVRALIAYNADSDISQTVLANGILFAQICPRGGVISGTSSVVKLSGWNWEDAAYHVDEGMHMSWPHMFKRKGDRDDPQGYETDEQYEENLREIRQFFEKAKAYSRRAEPLERDLKLESMRGVFNGEKRLYVNAEFIKEIREAVAFKREMGIAKLTIVGGYDSWMAADLLRENEVSVMIRRVNSMPRFAEDAIDAPFLLPARLDAAKVSFCFEMDGDMETMQNRNLPFNIGTAMGYGLSAEAALKGATINAARILGIDHLTGSIEIGKQANFVISEGDIFDMRTSVIRDAFLLGKPQNLKTHQDELYEKYLGKYGLPVE